MRAASRAVERRQLIYEWVGEALPEHTCNPERAVGEWFAVRCANELLHARVLDSRRFDKFVSRLAANVEAKLLDAAEGALRPGTDVVPLAGGNVADVGMFEFRWAFCTNLLHGADKVLVRHYDAEPADRPDSLFGLHIHRKDVDGDAADIKNLQNREIDIAVGVCAECVRKQWNV